MSGLPELAAAPAVETRVLTLADEAEWKRVLAAVGEHDFYHLPEYHRLAEQGGEGTAHLFVYREGDCTLGLPLLLRPVQQVPGLETAGEWHDATSVYGYSGPIASHALMDEAVIRRFQAALETWLRERRVAAIFSRLHPLFAQRHLLAGLGECSAAGQTVSIDLAADPEAQLAGYRSDHRRDLIELRRIGATCVHDAEWRYLDRFVEIYHDTMRRVGAQAGYFFDRAYFENLARRTGGRAHLFVCIHEGEVISAASILTCEGIVQGHLGGVDFAYRKLASNKLLIDEIRRWAIERGYRRFHLGGGVGAKTDSLFAFKSGFSNLRHDFATWQWVLEPEVYRDLCERKEKWNALHAARAISDSYFPRYRAATAPMETPAAQDTVSRSSSFRVLTTRDETEWLEVLRRTAQHDFHHLPQYHRLAEMSGEGMARLFVYHEGAHLLALPLLVRPIEGVQPEGWFDATSVYGYAGPLTSSADMPPEVLARFHTALSEKLAEQRIVSVFSRLHPLIPQSDFLTTLGEVRRAGPTVSIDLTLSTEAQHAQYSGTYRSRLRKFGRSGVICQIDPQQYHLAEFVDMYHETMRRVSAHTSYFFDVEYFDRLSRQLGGMLNLFITKADGEVVSGGLFTLCDGIMQYHLGATRTAFLKLSPMVLTLDTARQWGTEQGARMLHLGGGVGSREDSLFVFKAGFSKQRHRFETWRWVTVPEIYRQLQEERARLNEQNDLVAASEDYFPAYRCPATSRSAPPVESGAEEGVA